MQVPMTTTTAVGVRRRIRRVAVLGAGVMGSQIALHFAGVGYPVLLLDMAPNTLTPEEAAQGLSLEAPQVRNRIVNELFQRALKLSPAPMYDNTVPQRVRLGNFKDNLAQISEVDWIVEAVVEDLGVKRALYEEVEKYRRPGTLITTNTSGIPIHLLAEGRSEDFRRHFAGTHFFNPPRYLPLLEIIPGPDTDPEVIRFLMDFGQVHLGKQTVLCKDTPAFIANRIGVYAIMHLLHAMPRYGLSVEEIDQLTGPIIGHPKSATFRTADVVGLDTLVRVAEGLYESCPHDEMREVFRVPAYLKEMVEKGFLGEKAGKGFYQKVKANGSSEIHSIDIQSLAYRPQKKVHSPLLERLKGEDKLAVRLKLIAESNDIYAEVLKENMAALFAYISHRIPEISEEVYPIDDAVRAGFGWQLGPFEKWDAVGFEVGLAAIEKYGFSVAGWVREMHAEGFSRFYEVRGGRRYVYSPVKRDYVEVPGQDRFILLDTLRADRVIWRNNGASLFDLGDGVLCLEFHTKMNTVGGEVLDAINKSIDIAEKGYLGLIIGNQGENFSAGANLAMIFMMAVEQEWEELDYAVRAFQRTVLRLRHSEIPIVVAPHGLTLGGGCEMTLHADGVQAAAETYIGLVEVGVGLIPAGGGTKEMAARIAERYVEGDVEINYYRDILTLIATAKVATSAFEAIQIGLLRPYHTRITLNLQKLLRDAKAYVLLLAEQGYVPPQPREQIRVLGRTALGAVEASLYQMWQAGYITEYDRHVSRKVAYVLAGGDLTGTQYVSESYLLDLEREAFLSLCGEKRTLERIQHMLRTGKPLRN
ncbi:MAG: 3-hydroxyacyl-CoA dehydrogenase NAD-binding domain-containing protein [Bacteroidia bacterium]|nr:3-hydroxyacyl-CoA dehydrogenase NAD-binding domain-containing protein [Bacteroidia bacterium]MDW8133859.1 3-hydroxyacyl-CoA dehydrogenase NAD-binding domain-containing protein [Bacteroidia bacterium]